MDQFAHNLGTFKILFIVKGILNLMLGFIPLAYAAFFGFFASNNNFPHEFNTPPFNTWFIFVAIGIFGFLVVVTFGVLTLLAAKYIHERKHYTFIIVVSVLNCFTGVLGILLGVFTIIELNKPNVKVLFYPIPSEPNV